MFAVDIFMVLSKRAARRHLSQSQRCFTNMVHCLATIISMSLRQRLLQQQQPPLCLRLACHGGLEALTALYRAFVSVSIKEPPSSARLKSARFYVSTAQGLFCIHEDKTNSTGPYYRPSKSLTTTNWDGQAQDTLGPQVCLSLISSWLRWLS